MSDSDTVIRVEHVNKHFRLPHDRSQSLKSSFINSFKHSGGFENQQVLKDISFHVQRGEFLGIVGKNGSGKSTMLKLLAGIYTPNHGEIEVKGSLTPFIELGVGFNAELTGRENVFLNGALLGFDRKQIEDMYEDIVDFAELERFMDQKLKNYSSGMQVRLAFSIAIKAQSDILLIDEVLAVGDARFQQKCFEYFYELKQSNRTIVFISHDMDAIQKFCDRCIYIEDGILQAEGKPIDIVNKYLVKTFSEEDQKRFKEQQNAEKRAKAEAKKKAEEERLLQLSDTVTGFTATLVNKANSYKAGDHLKIAFDYTLAKPTDVEVRFAVVKDGIAMAHFNTRPLQLPSKVGKHTVTLHLQLDDFLGGQHEFNCGVFEKVSSQQLAYQGRAAKFFVSPTDQQYGGFFKLEGTWEV